jgi:ubiquitin-like-conjugating enzyme ATG3
VREEHANKTVTFEAHPHTGGSPVWRAAAQVTDGVCAGLSHASVHPCKHGAVMRRIVDLIQTPVEREGAAAPAAGAPPRVTVEQYLFIFLKFISTVIPTIEYDFTFHV